MNEVVFYKVDRNNICETRYFDGIAKALDGLLSGYSIIFTGDYETLPNTAHKKIVILGGEERGVAEPRPYAQYKDVVAVFRFYGVDGRCDNKYIFPIPCGYNCISNEKNMVRMYPEKKISEREIDIFYSGQLLNCRKELMASLERLRDNFYVFSQSTPAFRRGLDIDDYYQTLGNTKICVAPTGASIDTFRLVEACGSGCIVITTPKPNLWYYKDAPIFYVEDWTKLTKEFVYNILQQDLNALQIRMLNYYRQCLSEEAVASYIAVNTLRNETGI